MKIVIWLLMIIVFFYTIGFAITLLKEKNKVGFVATFLLAISIVVAPFFSVLK
jgi:hypothetical protein